MNFKHRIKSIEKHFIPSEGLEFDEILKPGYIYKGKPFDSWGEMCEGLNLVDLPPYPDIDEEVLLLEKKILSADSDIFKKISELAKVEMERSL